jgi:hypothetical protein
MHRRSQQRPNVRQAGAAALAADFPQRGHADTDEDIAFAIFPSARLEEAADAWSAGWLGSGRELSPDFRGG